MGIRMTLRGCSRLRPTSAPRYYPSDLLRPYLGAVRAIFHAGDGRAQIGAAEASGTLGTEVQVLPGREVADAAGEGELGPVLRQDHALRPLDDFYSRRLVELLGL